MLALLRVCVAAAGLFALTGAASAMPVSQPAAVAGVVTENAVKQVRWVCGPYGNCVWRPNYYRPYYGYYAPRYYAPRYYAPRYYGYYGGPRWRRW